MHINRQTQFNKTVYNNRILELFFVFFFFSFIEHFGIKLCQNTSGVWFGLVCDFAHHFPIYLLILNWWDCQIFGNVMRLTGIIALTVSMFAIDWVQNVRPPNPNKISPGSCCKRLCSVLCVRFVIIMNDIDRTLIGKLKF